MTDTIHHFPGLLIEAKATPEGIVAGLASPFGGDPDAYGDIVDAAPSAIVWPATRPLAPRP